MAKKITRTVTRAEICATLYNREAGTMDEQHFVIENPGKDILAAARKLYETEVVSVIDATLVSVVSTRFSMPLDDFMASATQEDISGAEVEGGDVA